MKDGLPAHFGFSELLCNRFSKTELIVKTLGYYFPLANQKFFRFFSDFGTAGKTRKIAFPPVEMIFLITPYTFVSFNLIAKNFKIWASLVSISAENPVSFNRLETIAEENFERSPVNKRKLSFWDLPESLN